MHFVPLVFHIFTLVLSCNDHSPVECKIRQYGIVVIDPFFLFIIRAMTYDVKEDKDIIKKSLELE